MNLDKLRNRLFAEARAVRPVDTVPYAFEKRVMANLPAQVNGWLLWGHALWRGAAACVALSFLLSIWSIWPQADAEPATLESTVFAAAEAPGEVW